MQTVESIPNSKRSRSAKQDECPHFSPLTKVDERINALVLAMRKNRKLGSKRILSELKLFI
jgi:hypothetical protein